MKIRQRFGLCLAVLVLIITLLIEAPYGLSVEGKNTIGITLFFLILLITEALPLPVSSLLTIGLTPIFNVTETFSGAVIGFAHPVIFFILASFGIAAAIMNVPITKRVLYALLKRAGFKVEMILFAMMIATAFVSFFMSNVPACAIMMAVALEFVDMLDNEEKKSIGKTFMIAIPVATMIGGIATPASSSLNLLAIGLLEQHTGITISFVQWMAIGIPLVVVLIPLAWLLTVKVYKPVQINREKIESYIENIRVKGPISKKELYVIIIMIITLALWIASSWVSEIEIFTVAVLCAVLFFLPGINVLDWGKFVKTINWDIIFISGTVLSTANALVENGVSAWLTQFLSPANFALSANALVGLASVFVFLMLLIITSAPALITVLAGSFVAIALSAEVNPAYLMIALAFCAGNCYLFPLDTVQLITYSKGYYKMTDMCRSTVFLQIAIVVLLMFWIPFMGGVLGL